MSESEHEREEKHGLIREEALEGGVGSWSALSNELEAGVEFLHWKALVAWMTGVTFAGLSRWSRLRPR